MAGKPKRGGTGNAVPSPGSVPDPARETDRELERTTTDEILLDQQALYQVYTDERKLLFAGEHDYSKERDKWLLTLAAGALGLSLTFVKTMSSPSGLSATGWLLGCWAFFGATIVLTLLSLWFSATAFKKFREILDAEFLRDNPSLDEVAKRQDRSGWVKATQWATRVAIMSFIAGVFCLASFTYQNRPILETSHDSLHNECKGETVQGKSGSPPSASSATAQAPTEKETAETAETAPNEDVTP